MIFQSIVARLDPEQSRIQVAAFSLFLVHLVRNALKTPEKRENAATLSQLCAGSRRATIA